MRLGALFWFYKDMETCQDRLRAVRRFNPDLDIYGLYGGEPSGAKAAEQALAHLLDDFWAYPEARDPKWKWTNGDLMIARWFRDRGTVLSWDTVFVIQWDMLVIDDDGKVNEVDLLVLAPGGLFLVEIKSRPGVLTGDTRTWTWITDGREYSYDNPALSPNRKASGWPAYCVGSPPS